MGKNSIHNCSVIDLPVIRNEAGNIAVLENQFNVLFDVKRVYFLYDIPANSHRGGHAHYELEQYVIAASGSFSFVLDGGNERKEVFLNRSNKALHIKKGIWRDMKDFSGGSVCLVLASMPYSESDYIRDFNEFKQKYEK